MFSNEKTYSLSEVTIKPCNLKSGFSPILSIRYTLDLHFWVLINMHPYGILFCARFNLRHMEYIKGGLKHMQLKFYIEGSEPGLKGIVHSESKEVCIF